MQLARDDVGLAEGARRAGARIRVRSDKAGARGQLSFQRHSVRGERERPRCLYVRAPGTSHVCPAGEAGPVSPSGRGRPWRSFLRPLQHQSGVSRLCSWEDFPLTFSGPSQGPSLNSHSFSLTSAAPRGAHRPAPCGGGIAVSCDPWPVSLS